MNKELIILIGNTPKLVWEEVWKIKNKEYEEPSTEGGFGTIIKLK